MEIVSIACYLVYPGKGQENPQSIQGTLLPLEGRLYGMLQHIFDRSESECNIPIRFLMDDDGNQENDVRDLVFNFGISPTLENGDSFATRLRDQTTRVPGLGLLFIIAGQRNTDWKVVLSRFPVEQGVTAEVSGDRLEVEFIERIFMKNVKSYKAALYFGTSLEEAPWSGFAVDKQVRVANIQIANYWIRDFLASDFKSTSKAASRRTALAFREASKQAPDIETKQELVSASTLVSGFDGQAINLEEVMDRLNLSEESQNLLKLNLPHEGLISDTFTFDKNEFNKHAAFTSVELDNGGLMTAPSEGFNDIFQEVLLDEENQIYRYTTEGSVTNRQIRARK